MDRAAVESAFRDLSQNFEGEIRFEEPLSKHTYYKIGGPARVLVIPKGVADLSALYRVLDDLGLPSFVMGLGSNILASDLGFDGVVIKTTRLNLEITEHADELLDVGSSVPVSTFLRKAAQMGWGGFEFLGGVPGSMGGVVYMNAGTHLGEAKDRLRSVSVFDGTTARRMMGPELKYEYRKNEFILPREVVIESTWKFNRDAPANVKSAIDAVLARRKSIQPIEFPSCGSVFKNPRQHGLRAWEVLDRLGLRGRVHGGAQFSDMHPNFIINRGSAKAEDVRTLILLAKQRAQTELGIILEEELKYLGFS